MACGGGNGSGVSEATPAPSPTASPTPTPTSTPTPAPTPTPTPVPFDPTAVLERSGMAMQDLDSFRFELTHNEGGTQFIPGLVVEEAQGDVVKPDRLSLKFSGIFGGGYAIKSTLISVSGTTYMTNPLTGAWQEMDDTVSPLGFFNPAVGIAAMMLQLEDEEEVETGRDDVHRLTGTLPAVALSPLLGTAIEDAYVDVDLTIDSERHYLLEAIVSGRVIASDEAGIVRTIELRDFGEPIEIEAPQ